MSRLLHHDDLGKLLLRLAVGGLILLHGIDKLLNPASITDIGNMLAAMGVPVFLAYGVLIGEIVAPLMVILGWQARIGGLLMAGNMLVAFVLVHHDEWLALNAQGGWALELQGLFLIGALAIAFMGSGRLAMHPD
ncbi:MULTISPECIES: DoxX family protein [Chromohalobacter]|uniref:DoxX family protein n=1 Tax=Chromohalobacter TaxID=42054 RepID=UPI000D71882F|nr:MULTISPECIES: DoxX family protein [Chromohalobacter]MBZ5877119.1 DoxX family protein [Chromohalobacter salexigens]NQY47166.1 DoxX family protein [Chromohalobacter sp.]PWW36277.1 putative oxidoreductase [Chromohalobacter salexigens]